MSTTDLVDRSDSQSAGVGWYRFAPGIRGEGTAARRAWQARYVRHTVLFDAVAAAAAFGLWSEWGEADGLHPPMWITAGLPLVWLPALLVARTYEKRFLWVHPVPYSLIGPTAPLRQGARWSGGPPRAGARDRARSGLAFRPTGTDGGLTDKW